MLVAVVVVLMFAGQAWASLDAAVLYRAHCARCHGLEGRGDGPEAAAFAPHPRDLREGFLRRYETDQLVAKVRSGTPLTLTLDPIALRRTLHDVDALTTFLPRLPWYEWAEVRRGRETFELRCVGCHGATGEGAGPTGSLKRTLPDLGSPQVRERLAGDRMVAAVRHILPGMPGLRQVPDTSDARDLAAYVRVLSPGYRLYARYCAGCHGEDGQIAPGAPADMRPKVVFDATYFDRLGPHELEEAVTHMVIAKPPRMPHLSRTLNEPEARAIVEYLQRLP